MRLVMLLVLVASLTGCQSTLELPEIESHAELRIEVSPADIVRTIVLEAVGVSDTLLLQANDYVIVFDSISLGQYSLTVSAEGYGTFSDVVYVNSRREEREVLLSTMPAQIYDISPSAHSGDTISRLTQFEVTLCGQYDTASLYNLLSFNPPISYEITRSSEYSSMHEVTILPSPYEMFLYDSITLQFSDTVAARDGEVLEMPYSITYCVDTTVKDIAVKDYFVDYFRPYTNCDVDDDIRFLFEKQPLPASLDAYVRIEPALLGEWYTSDYVNYRFLAGDGLRSGTTYTVTIDSGFVFSDSSVVLSPLEWQFTTVPLGLNIYETYPRNYTTTALLDSAFVLVFNVPLDSASFVDAFSITPPLDSISYEFTPDRKQVLVHHADLVRDTQYTLVIDTLLTDCHGEAMAEPKVMTFSAK